MKGRLCSKSVIRLIILSLLWSSIPAGTGFTPVYALGPNDPLQAYALNEGQGSTTIDSVSGNSHAISGTPAWVTGYTGQALAFNGLNSSVVMDDFDKQSFTLMAWIKPASYSNSHTIIGQGIAGGQNNLFNWWVSGDSMFFLMSDSSGNSYGLWPLQSPAGSIPQDVWSHVAVSRDGSTYHMYVNGVWVSSKTTYASITQSSNPNPLRIGAVNNSSGQATEVFNGILDDVRIYPQALSSQTILNIKLGLDVSPTTYYVDSVGGSDSNSGTSVSSPWKTLAKVNATTFQAGDKILFKAGSSWTGQLWPKGSGSSGYPVVVDRYGSGAKPLINGAGLYTETVRLFNQQHWEINNLSITNEGAQRASRRAVWIEAQNIGTASHIYLKNLDIRNVNGLTEVQDLESGGIIVRVTGYAAPTKFDDVLIQDNTFTDVDSTGIFIRSDWRNRATRTDGSGPWLGMTRVVVRGNSLNRTGGDAIIICESAAPLIEYNVAANSYYDSVGYHAGIWAINSDNALFQYNEAYLTRTVLDGMGFDLDELCGSCIMQHNYSHDNEGGFMLLVGQRGPGTGYDQNGIVRYNISENDNYALFQYVGRLQNYHIYNNTFYTAPGMNVRFAMAPDISNFPQGSILVTNNIIYNQGSNMTYYCGGASCVYDYNVFYGNHDASEPADPHKLTSDPLLTAPGTGGIGRSTTGGYKLAAGSPAIGSGKLISGNGGSDYWGNAVSATSSPNRGAYNGPGITGSYAAIPGRSITVDGILDTLSSTPGIDLESEGQFLITGYGGPNDLSGKLWVTWDSLRLYLSAKIKDDTFSQSASGSMTWQGDGIQFGVTPGAPGVSSAWYEYGMSLTVSGPELYRWSSIGMSAGLVSNRQLAISRNETAKETIYELGLPWSELSPVTSSSGLFSLSLLVNENDGAGRRGWVEWGGGIGGTKDNGAFKAVRLTGP
ncbi:LamG-like jellyroll fold domain-containing protein [Paenibacillus nasutitermitis]|uniref:LamG-like jellyroll fold domain-containing protein n=1 Tax=Paenibacillus nasutitermitis TaxID=1652958 RepID=A0A917DMF7_9BACL|nr:LamG-like jellyroll fold domain-containing protein [Paenibacillus nasutitermitis]GGD51406.1 hypothetical protein GCM10010911_06160 [Paenibacillus nasutitermitis]